MRKIIGNEELKWVRIKDYGGRLFVADTIDLNYKELQNCKKQIEKIESIWIGLQFWSSFFHNYTWYSVPSIEPSKSF